MTVTKQLILVLVKEIIAEKKQLGIVPNYAFVLEISTKVTQALNELVADGSLIERQASVNRLPAYEIPCQREQT